MAQTFNKGKVSDMADPTSDNSEKGAEVMKSEDALQGRKLSWGKLRRIDSLHLEAERVSNIKTHGAQVSWSRTLRLAFQSIWGGVWGHRDITAICLFEHLSRWDQRYRRPLGCPVSHSLHFAYHTSAQICPHCSVG